MNQVQQQYIDKKLNPVLEKMVEQVLEELPEELGDYLGAYFVKEQGGTALVLGGSKEDVTSLQAEVASLTEQLKQHKQYCAELEKVIIQIAPKTQAGGSAPEEDPLEQGGEELPDKEVESEEGSDDEMEPPPMVEQRPRTSVSAEAYGDWNKKATFVPRVHAKTPIERAQLKAILQKIFMFVSLSDKDMETVLDAMKQASCKNGQQIIKQGEEGATCMYVVLSGSLSCYVMTPEGEKMVKTINAGEVVGELALLYNCPRAASVRAADGDVALWELDRETFNAIVKEAGAKTREKNDAFLKKVQLFSILDAYDRSRVAECLRPETYPAGQKIVKIGDAGDRMFFVEEGTCEATRSLNPGEPEEVVMTYSSGDIFGELAVIRNKVRQANVIAKGEVKVMSLLASDFRRMCGTLEEKMLANAKSYRGPLI